MRVIWNSDAQADLFDIYDYIAQDNIVAAAEVIDIIIDVTENQLKAHPYAGHVGKVKETYELVIPHYNYTYVSVYIVDKEYIEIIAVMHSRKKWPHSFKN